ncbi:MAG: PrsW family glutamic-type intramembrane protease [Bacteroidales bacterium]
MIRSLLFVSLAPVLIIAIYVFFRDKYEKEPVGRLLLALTAGLLIVPPVIAVERFLMLFSGRVDGIFYHFYHAFVVASFTEEGFKYLAFMLLIWRSRDFNEKFDGIMYAVFISLGFAAVENLLYVYKGGYQVGLLRAFTAVPAHAIFGIAMGYHFGLAKFYTQERKRQLVLAFVYPFLWHGAYDFLLMAGKSIYLILFIPLIILLWMSGFKRMKRLSEISVYRMTGLGVTDTARAFSHHLNSGDDATNISDQA